MHAHTNERNTLSFFNPWKSLFLRWPLFSRVCSVGLPVVLSPSKRFSILRSLLFANSPGMYLFSSLVVLPLDVPLSPWPLFSHARMCFYARSGALVTLCATLCVPLEPHYPRVKVSLRPAARLEDEQSFASFLSLSVATPRVEERDKTRLKDLSPCPGRFVNPPGTRDFLPLSSSPMRTHRDFVLKLDKRIDLSR